MTMILIFIIATKKKSLKMFLQKKILWKFNILLDHMKEQGYDNCANMRGQQNSVQVVMFFNIIQEIYIFFLCIYPSLEILST